jgi:hypothetical protein
MERRVRTILIALLFITGCAQLKGITSDGSSQGVPKEAKLVAESCNTVGIFHPESDGTIYIVNAHPKRKRPDVLMFSGPIEDGQVLKIDTAGDDEPLDATLAGKSLGLKLAGGAENCYRVYFAPVSGLMLGR